jgi:hypothetical protein
MRLSRLTVWGALDRLHRKRLRIWRSVKNSRPRLPIAQPAYLLLWLSLGLGLAGCAGIGVSSSAEAKQRFVAERAQARWQVLMKGDVEGAYQFLSAGSKAATPLEVYKAKIRPGMWRAAKVDKVDCEAEICKVMMTITYDTKPMRGIQTPFPETWIIENGSAWYIYR